MDKLLLFFSEFEQNSKEENIRRLQIIKHNAIVRSTFAKVKLISGDYVGGAMQLMMLDSPVYNHDLINQKTCFGKYQVDDLVLSEQEYKTFDKIFTETINHGRSTSN